ncbi:hypothetical protein U4E84_13710 [Halorubrum sp. AD140]|uniref:hypothetical protein n=1 Tax=Halorubrum sp. AD140 TaxID=3050073 RepID=UPI002ACCC527|nr:hypothetical protein [Halorubrum sp. AD140]MDZ5812401.1 hypothetical protein [Halorubrum sp. AD140]
MTGSIDIRIKQKLSQLSVSCSIMMKFSLTEIIKTNYNGYHISTVPVGRYIRGLNSYDLLGNLIPGIVALVVTLGVFTTPPIPDSIEEYALFAVIAYLTGNLIQSVASTAVGDRRHFDRTMSDAEMRTKSELAEAETESSSDEPSDGQKKPSENNRDRLFWKIVHPYIWPLAVWFRPPRGERLEDAILVNRIWEYLIDTHEIPFRTTSYGVLYHVMSSRVDNIQSPSRAVRMQALRNLNRGMWITSWYASLLLGSVLIIDWQIDSGEMIHILDLEYEQPLFFEYWIPVWILVLVSLVGVMFFWVLAESTEEDYIEYLFADYVVAVASEAEDISFDQDTPLRITGQLASGPLQFELSEADDGNEGVEKPMDPTDGEESADKSPEEKSGDSDSSHRDDDAVSE